jgi:hypothetical protein
MNHRPTCPRCSAPVNRLRRSPGIVAAYPCNHWLTPDQAAAVRDAYHARQQAEGADQ